MAAGWRGSGDDRAGRDDRVPEALRAAELRYTQTQREAARAQHGKGTCNHTELSAVEQMLLHQYGGPMIALERVVGDFFPELTVDTFLRRHAEGEIALKITRMNASSQKATRFVYLRHLADFIEARAAVATAA